MQFTFKIWDKIKEAWGLYKKHFGVLLLLVIITFVVQMLGYKNNFALSMVLNVLNLFLSYIWIHSILNLIDKKEFTPFSKESLPSLLQFWNLFKTTVLYVLCVLAGFVLFVIPGFYVSGRLMFAIYISVEKNQGARLTIREAWKMTEGYGWKLFWKGFVVGLFMAIGFIIFFVGSFVTYPVGFIVMVMMYREFIKMKTLNPSPSSPDPVVVPSSDIPKDAIKEEIIETPKETPSDEIIK
jgi:hypothetical protein